MVIAQKIQRKQREIQSRLIVRIIEYAKQSTLEYKRWKLYTSVEWLIDLHFKKSNN